MRILGLDTATWCASVGILIDGTIVAEESQSTDSHAVSLLPLIERVLQQGACAVDELDAVAVSSGPGSFTGLRIGISVAKGLACAGGLDIVGVPTLEALARSVASQHGAICTLLDARRGELYMACFEAVDGVVKRLTTDSVVTPEQVLARIPTPCVIVGDAVVTYGATLQAARGDRVRLLPFPDYGPRGGVVAALGWERLQAGNADALPSLEPIYILPSEAERKDV